MASPVAQWFPRPFYSSGWPLGISGMFGAPQTPEEKIKVKEDAARSIIDSSDRLVLAIVYKSLYALGYRMGTIDAEIASLKKAL